MKIKKFKDLRIGEKFVFESEISLPFSGLAKGPWIKTSARKYRHADPLSRNHGYEHRVGSVAAEVITKN